MRFKGQFDLGCETFPITNGAAMAPKVLQVLKRNKVEKKLMGTTYDGGKNLQTMADATDKVAACTALGDKTPGRNDCSMHFFGGSIGAALNAPVDNELGLLGLGKYKIKPAQQCFQKTVTWTKKSSSGARKWSQSCVESDLKPIKLITPVKT